MQFEWDDKKNAANIRKHGISFERAIAIFKGFVLTKWEKHSNVSEDQEISIGIIEGERVIVVIHADRGDRIRIISARRATKKERRIYYGYYY